MKTVESMTNKTKVILTPVQCDRYAGFIGRALRDLCGFYSRFSNQTHIPGVCQYLTWLFAANGYFSLIQTFTLDILLIFAQK